MDEMFGRYRLIELIGEGGMGKVFKAHDTTMRRDVAVKVLPAELAAAPGYRERFEREAYTAARLTEPHIIPIYEAGEIDGRLYLVMPVIDGTDLASVLKRHGPMSPQLAVYVIDQLASALDAAHAAGLVHRDVKPTNALMTDRSFVYLIDFGIAHDVAATKLTRTGAVLGTLAYMAPERYKSGAADARADVYALAAVLHECLTGNQPFPGDSLPQQMHAHLYLDPPRPSGKKADIPKEFDDVIARGMAKEPDRRYESAGELANAAHGALTETSGSVANSPTAATIVEDSALPPVEPTMAAPLPERIPTDKTTTPGLTPQSATLFADPARAATQERAPGDARQRKSLRFRNIIIAAVIVLVVAAGGLVGYRVTRPDKPDSGPIGPSAPVSPPNGPASSPAVRQTALPFIGLGNPAGVAVDAIGNVYVADSPNNRVVRLNADGSKQAVLPFTDLRTPISVAADTSGNVYVADYYNQRVVKLAPGATTQTVLPFTDLKAPSGVAVDTAGNVYAAVTEIRPAEAISFGRVMKLAPDATQAVLPFEIGSARAVAVDDSGSVYVLDKNNNQVVKLAPGATTQTVLLSDRSLGEGLAVADDGSVYFTRAIVPAQVVMQPAGSTIQTTVPFTDVSNLSGLAVGKNGTVYVADSGNSRVLKLPAQ